MSDELSISLVGRLHRTVFVEGCNPSFYDELAMLFAKKCGSIEARGMVGKRYAVVFESLNSVSNAVALHGMSFMDLSSKLLIWAADKTPPAEASQLALGGPSTASGNAGGAEISESRRKRLEAFLALGGGIASSSDTCSTAQERQLRLYRLCFRQVKALSVILQFEMSKLKSQCSELERAVSNTTSILKRLRDRDAPADDDARRTSIQEAESPHVASLPAN